MRFRTVSVLFGADVKPLVSVCGGLPVCYCHPLPPCKQGAAVSEMTNLLAAAKKDKGVRELMALMDKDTAVTAEEKLAAAIRVIRFKSGATLRR